MYSILLAFSLSLLVSVGGFLLDWWHWAWAIPIALFVFAVCWVLIARNIGKKLQPMMLQAQQQMQSNMLPLAMQTLRDMKRYGNWMPMLNGQINAQLGALEYAKGDKEQGLALLEKSSVRNADARLLLASIHHKEGDVAQALSVLEFAGKVSRKHSLLHNTHAWLLHKAGRKDEAQSTLATFLKKNPNDQAAKENLLRLQNNQRLNMARFETWYQLGFEAPPTSMGMQMRRAPKGFREPPKQSQKPRRKRG